MPGRSPHRRSSPSLPMVSHRGRLRSPERRRPVDGGSPSRSRRPADFRSGPVRRSHSPVEKTRSLSPPIKRNQSPKRVRENSRRPQTSSSRKLSRSKSPVSSPRLQDYKAVPSTSGTKERRHSDSYERQIVKFREPEESKAPVTDTTHIKREITNPEEIVPVRRIGEGSRPIFMRPELMGAVNQSCDDEEYRKIVTIDAVQSLGRERSDRSRGHSCDCGKYSPEVRSRHHHSSDRDRSRSPCHSSSRRSPHRTEYYESREKVCDARCGSSRDDVHRELEVRKHDDEHYREKHRSCEKERERLSEKRSESLRHHGDRHYERERKRSVSQSPREQRRGSIDTVQSRRERDLERERERDRRGERHARTRSRSRERIEERSLVRRNEEERYDEEFDDDIERTRRYPHRAYYVDESEFIPVPVPIRPRGPPIPMRGIPVPMIPRPMMRAAPPRLFRGVPVMRGWAPRAPFIRYPPGFLPRFYPPPF